jgi:hypothetical protein
MRIHGSEKADTADFSAMAQKVDVKQMTFLFDLTALFFRTFYLFSIF